MFQTNRKRNRSFAVVNIRISFIFNPGNDFQGRRQEPMLPHPLFCSKNVVAVVFLQKMMMKMFRSLLFQAQVKS